MKSAAIVAGVLATAAVAQPHGHAHRRAAAHKHAHDKRSAVVATEWVTVMETVTEVVEDSTTFWVYPSTSSTPTTTSTTISSSQTPGQFIESTTATSTSSSLAVESSSTKIAVAVSSSSYVAPAPEPTTSTTPVYTPPAAVSTTSTSVVEAAAPVTTEIPTVTSSAPVVATSSASSGSSSGSGSGYSGDLTYYTLGEGSCGINNAGDDMSANVVALSHVIMSQYTGGNPNNNPMCNRKIIINDSVLATVVDTCEGCVEGAIDVSQTTFIQVLGDLGIGRKNVVWRFAD